MVAIPLITPVVFFDVVKAWDNNVPKQRIQNCTLLSVHNLKQKMSV